MSVKKVQIRDMDDVKHFQIRLFNAMDGLDFIDRFVSQLNSKEHSVKPFLKDLLPLATLMDVNGVNPVQEMSLESASAVFKSPIAILELGMKVLEHQEVFLKNSENFQPLMARLKSQFGTKNSEFTAPLGTC